MGHLPRCATIRSIKGNLMLYDRRAEPRHRVLKEGKVLLYERVALECIVHDLTTGGARIVLARPVSLPRDFRLCIISADFTIPVACVWQRQLHAGLRFTGVGTVGQVDNSPIRLQATG